MKLFTAAAVAILLSSGMAYAQDDTTTTGSTTSEQGGSGTDAATYLTGPNIQRFYQNDQMEELRSEAEIKATWDAMSETDRESLRVACASNEDMRFDELCKSVGVM